MKLNSFSEYSNTGSATDRPFANMEIGFLKNFILTADYSYYNYKNDENTVKNTYSFLNANLYYQQKDSKWEFKISANNLTNNTSMNTDSYNEISDSNTTSLYFIQPRLYMFSVKYNVKVLPALLVGVSRQLAGRAIHSKLFSLKKHKKVFHCYPLRKLNYDLWLFNFAFKL